MLKLIDLFDQLDTKNGWLKLQVNALQKKVIFIYLDCYVRAKQYLKIKNILFEEYGQQPMTRAEEEAERKRFILMDLIFYEKICSFFRIIKVQ